MKASAALARAIANARPRVVAALAAHLRDLDAAEDAFAEATAALLSSGVAPDRPAAWLYTAARRKAVDAIRRREAEARAVDGAALVGERDGNDVAEILTLPDPIPDERLRLIFICCHPAIAPEARAALAMKVICGLPVSAIARVFVTSEATMLGFSVSFERCSTTRRPFFASFARLLFRMGLYFLKPFYFNLSVAILSNSFFNGAM